jgi:hypothetical protein
VRRWLGHQFVGLTPLLRSKSESGGGIENQIYCKESTNFEAQGSEHGH